MVKTRENLGVHRVVNRFDFRHAYHSSGFTSLQNIYFMSMSRFYSQQDTCAKWRYWWLTLNCEDTQSPLERSTTYQLFNSSKREGHLHKSATSWDVPNHLCERRVESYARRMRNPNTLWNLLPGFPHYKFTHDKSLEQPHWRKLAIPKSLQEHKNFIK